MHHIPPEKDLKNFVLPDVGQLLETGDPWEPYRLLDPAGDRVEPVAVYFQELRAADKSASTLRSYGHDLLLCAGGVFFDVGRRGTAP